MKQTIDPNATMADTVAAALGGDANALEWLQVCAPDMAEVVQSYHLNSDFQVSIDFGALSADRENTTMGGSVYRNSFVERRLRTDGQCASSAQSGADGGV